MDMHSSFWIGIKIKDFLFKDLDVHSISGLLALCAAIVAAAIAFEGLKVLHSEVKLQTISLSSHITYNLNNPTDGDFLLENSPEKVRKRRAICYMLEISLYVVQVVMGYLLMLTVMTYNVYLSLAVLLGVAVGYFFFGHLLIEKRLKNVQLTMPCQDCVQDHGKEEITDEITEDSMMEGEAGSSGCCSGTQQSTLETTEEVSD